MSFDTKKSGGIWIPHEVLAMDVTHCEMLVRSIILNYEKAGLVVGNDYIAKRLGVTTRYVRMIKERIQLGTTVPLFGTTVPATSGTTVPLTRNHSSAPYNKVLNKNNKILKNTKKIIHKKYTTKRSLDFSTEDIEDFTKTYPNVDVPYEIETARLWLESTGRQYKSYRAFIQTWFRRREMEVRSKPAWQKAFPTKERQLTEDEVELKYLSKITFEGHT